MNKSTDLLIIGGGPAGMVCATTARKNYPDKDILLLRDRERGVVPCGIPYTISSLETPADNEMGYDSLEKKNIASAVGKAVDVDEEDKTVYTKAGDEYSYEKLVLATGSSPAPPPITGIDKENVFSIKKDMNYLERTVDKLEATERVVIVGGGFIGLEIADELSRADTRVTIVEVEDNILPNSFDPGFSTLAAQKLEKNGVEIITGRVIEEIQGETAVDSVLLSDGSVLEADAVVAAAGGSPNTELAEKLGLLLTDSGRIWTDEYMRTKKADIFAIGDCAGKRDFFTRKDNLTMLASMATAEARIAGANIYELKTIRENKGTVGIYSTYIDGLVLGCAGLTERAAEEEGFITVNGEFEVMDKHPGKLPGASKQKVKLIFSRNSGIIMGGQIAGGMSCGELINTIGLCIQKRVSFNELSTLQMATHPYLTAPPTKYPLARAAQNVADKVDLS
ncbi:MAG: FAD-dependent oxidoreductase [bacterium]